MAASIKSRPLRLRFHAVSIVGDANACAQARALKGVRLLSLEAPRLPIVGCTNPEGCQCRFQHHEDRRGPPRRSGLRPSAGVGAAPESNRRRMPGRRDSDYADD
jgi:hypothetical protein